MDSNVVITQFTSSAIVVWGLQELKNATWFPWLQKKAQTWTKRGASIVAAFGVHTGIEHVWNPGTVAGTHVLLITIPSLSVIAVGIWHWIGQYAMQETVYQATYNRNTSESVTSEEKK